MEEGAALPGIESVVESDEEGEVESGGEDGEDADFVGRGAGAALLGAGRPRRSQRLASGAGAGGAV